MAVRRIAHPSVDDRKAVGLEARDQAALSSHTKWRPAADRPDPVGLLEDQDTTREPDLVPVRHGRMMVSPFTFYRGAAKIMAADLKDTPVAGLEVQLCGDAHLSNFGLFASPERILLFDVNDFDETLPGPFEYDVKRMAASFTIAARNNGFAKADAREVTLASVRAYREAMASFAQMGTMDMPGSRAAVRVHPEVSMSTPSRENALDHVVVVMFENRSFDNLLGRLYEPGEVASFEGVIGKELSNRVPDWAEHRPQDGIVSYGVAANMNTPSPDSGEEYPHINTQLFGILDEENRFKLQAEKSFNEPRDGQPPTMDGFLADYISVLTVELGRQPTVEEYSQIMTGYTPEQMPVLSAIARGFATFDHWFCDVPTCTYPNRSFFHAGASSGYVVNTSPPGSFPRTQRRGDAV